MKVIFLCLLVLLPFTASALIDDYPDRTRYVEYSIPGIAAYVLVDTKTGCEYLRTSVANGTAYTLVQGSCKVQESNNG